MSGPAFLKSMSSGAACTMARQESVQLQKVLLKFIEEGFPGRQVRQFDDD